MLDLLAASAAASAAVAILRTAGELPGVSEAIAAARAAAAELNSERRSCSLTQGTPPGSTLHGSAASTAGSGLPATDLVAAAQAAAKVALGANGAPPALDEATKRTAAAAAFAQSLQQAKKSRWGASELAVREPELSGAGPAGSDSAKVRQALAVSGLGGALAAFRKDRGVSDPSTRKSLKVPVPEQDEGGRPKNWAGILIGKDGINKKRFEQQTGATFHLRGKGALHRTQNKADEGLEPLHVVLEADTEEALDVARVQVWLAYLYHLDL